MASTLESDSDSDSDYAPEQDMDEEGADEVLPVLVMYCHDVSCVLLLKSCSVLICSCGVVVDYTGGRDGVRDTSL